MSNDTTKTEKPLWGLGPIGEALGVGRSRLHDMINQGHPFATKVLRKLGGRWYAFPSEIESYLRTNHRDDG